MLRRRSIPHIVLNNGQARIISESAESVYMNDRSGKHLEDVVHGFTDEDMAISKERMASDEPRYTTQEVVDHIQSWDQK